MCMELLKPKSRARVGSTDSTASSARFPIVLEGTVRPFVCNIAEDQFIRFSGPNCHVQVFLVAWMDKTRGEIAHVAFPGKGGGLGVSLWEWICKTTTAIT